MHWFSWSPVVGLAADVYDVEWAEVSIFTRPDLTTGTFAVEVIPHPASTTADPKWEFRDPTTHTSVCAVWADEPNVADRFECSSSQTGMISGTLTWYPEATATGMDPHRYFEAEAQGMGHGSVKRWLVGAKRLVVTPPPGNRKVALTSPKANSPVCCTQAVNIWVEGAAAGTNTFTLAVDGKTIATQNCGCTHVWPAWNTKLYANGTHTVTATVTDSTGKSGSLSITVLVQN